MGFAEIVNQIYLQPWYDSLADPSAAQNSTLKYLLESYRKTQYGSEHGADEVRTIEEYRARFPTVNYAGLRGRLEDVRAGNYRSILPEPAPYWVMTRGSTGSPKVIPVTKTHIDQVRVCGARAILNFARRNPESEVLRGKVLNLNFPSAVDTMIVDGVRTQYGYSSGTYARLIPSLNETSLLPRQEDIDALGPGISKSDWDARFELAHRVAKHEDVKAVMGVAPVITSFGRYMKKRGASPKSIWSLEALFCTSVAKIHKQYAPVLRRLYGDAPVVEMYSATEGVYAQQLDDLPYVCPNYDCYLFEVEMGKRTKMLYEMSRGEWGRLIVSSCLFPRYMIGDLIECLGSHYYRVFGRDRTRVLVEHLLYRMLTRWFI